MKTKDKGSQILITGLQKDKVDLLKVSDDFKNQLINKQKALIECEESKPSRFTWFGIGFVTALVIGIVGAFAIKK